MKSATPQAGAINARDQKIVELRRQKALGDIKRNNAREDCQQQNTTTKKKRKGGGVKDNMKNDATIARNKKRWTDMTKRRKPMNIEQEAPPVVDETKKGDDVVVHCY